MRFRNGILTMLALNALVSLGQSNLSFKKVKLVEKDGRVENALLDFVSDRKLIAILDSHQTAIDIPYNKIARISYGRTEHNQTGKMVALGAMSYGLGALLVPKAVQYHLFIDYDEQGSPRQVELIASDSDFERIRRIAGMETGKEIVAEGGVAPAAAAAAGPSSPTAGTAQPAASALPAAAIPPPSAAAPATPSRAAVTITSTPPKADIQVNGVYSGSTPSTLKLDPGNYMIAVEKQGYASWQRSLTVTATTAVALDAQLAASTQPTSATAPAPAAPQTAQTAPPAPVPAAPASAPAAAPQPVETPAPYLHPVKLGSQWGYVDPEGRFRYGPAADTAELYSEGRALVAVAVRHGISSFPNGLSFRSKEYRYGWIDESGRVLIPTEFTLGGPFSEGLAPAGHTTGSTRASCDFSAALMEVINASTEEAACTPDSKIDFVDKAGNIVLHTDFAEGQKFSEKLAAVAVPGAKPNENRWGYIDHTGNLVIAARYFQAHPFTEGLAAVEVNQGAKAKGKEWGFIDHAGNLAIQPEFQAAEDFSEGLAGVEYPSEHPVSKPSHEAHPREKRWGYIDRSGLQAIPSSFVMVQPFYEGLAAVNTETMVVPEGGAAKNRRMIEHAQWSFIDRTGRIVIPGPFEATNRFSGGVAGVKQNGLWGYIDTAGAFRVPPQFQAAHIFRGDRAAVQLGAKWGFIDRAGKFVVPPQFDDIK